MGWDAHSSATRFKEFEAAAKRVAKKAGCADGFLAMGSLDCSACADAIERATGASAWDEDGWEPKKVARLAKSARWPKPSEVEKDRLWATLSAKEFLTICARRGYRIDFSY